MRTPYSLIKLTPFFIFNSTYFLLFPIHSSWGFSRLILVWMLMSVFLPPSTPDPNDESCLTKLFESMEDPNHNLMNWTKPSFENPCSGFLSNLAGATCNNGRIYKLSLPNLALRGSISPFISNCTNLQALDISNNSLTGPIPKRTSVPCQPRRPQPLLQPSLRHHPTFARHLGSLARLSVFDVSNNKLSGPIPASLGNRTGNLPRFNASSFLGNKDLYGYPLGPMKSKGLSVVAIVGIGLGSGLLSLVLSFTVVCVWLRVTEKKMAAEQEGKISQLMPEY
ncbi:unnamed protein product [Lactuca saligna]|uniref:Leucine-rich repeat-containing N-terminal plant-type domain-containing protein n=1 Tax=Lactuca saligna TaxID=75948 RepID=A0AA35VP63_LACSI|nr:unnamed protein product [Lactuca saligna]